MLFYEKDKKTYFKDIPDIIRIIIAYELIFTRYNYNSKYYSVKQVNKYLDQNYHEINVIADEIIQEINGIVNVDDFVQEYLEEHFLFCFNGGRDYMATIMDDDGNFVLPKGKKQDLELFFSQKYFTNV